MHVLTASLLLVLVAMPAAGQTGTPAHASSAGRAPVSQVLDEAARQIPPELRSVLALKPAPWIVNAHDVGAPTDVHKDIPWHLLDKEKDPRFDLPHRGKLGVFNTNADIHWLIGLGLDDGPMSYDPPRRYTDHLVNLAAQEIDLGAVRAHVLFAPVASDTLLAVVSLSNPGDGPHAVTVESLCTKPAGAGGPAVEEPAAAWSRPTDRFGYGITVTSGRIESIESVGERTMLMRFEELDEKKQPGVGWLWCAMSALADPISTRPEPESTAGPSGAMTHRIELPAGQTRELRLALTLHRSGPRQIETRNQIVLYPEQSDETARAYCVEAAGRGLAGDWAALARESYRWYERMPFIELPDASWTAAFACALELPRGNTWSPQGVLAQPWYTFCRVHGHEPYGWWSYGMHAHEHLSTFVVNLTEPTLSQSFLRGHFQVQQPDGCIQYGVNQSGRNIHRSLATAPLLAGEAWTAYLWSGDRAFLAQAFEACSRYVEWWCSSARTRLGEQRQAAQDSATPAENLPRLQHWRDFVETLRDDKDLATWTATDKAELQEALDLNCYLLNEERSLAAMARELGRTDQADRWHSRAEARVRAMQQHLWHAEDGVFYGKDIAGDRWARVLDVSTFFPLWAGLAAPEQAESIVRLLADPQAFGTDYPIASLAVKHMPDKLRGQYHWRGANWVEMSWLAVQGLSRYGHDAEAARVAEANCRMVFRTLERTGHFREFYNTLTGEPSDLTDYIWTSMPAIMIVETFFGIRPTPQGLEIRPSLPQGWDEIRIRNLRIRGASLSLSVRRHTQGLELDWNGHSHTLLPGASLQISWSQLQTK